MTELSVHSRFRVRGIWVRPEVLGSRYSWKVGGHQVDLVLPVSTTDFKEPDHTEEPHVEAWIPTDGNGGQAGGVIVHLIKTEVRFTGTLSAATKQDALQARDAGDDATFEAFNREVQAECNEGHRIGERLAHTWLSHVRTSTEQPWLGVRAEPPRQHGRCWLEDRDAGVRLIQLGPLQSASIRLGVPLVSLADLDRVRDLVDGGHEPPTAETLLADARFLVREAEVVDAQRAVLIAAMACEIKVKSWMSENADPHQFELLQLVLQRTSNLPSLLDQPLRAAVGVSLKAEDRELFKAVEQLATLRNRIVHQGDDVERGEAWRMVAAAQQLFRWLGEVQIAQSGPKPTM